MEEEYIDLLDENGNKLNTRKKEQRFIEMAIGISQFIFG